MLTEIYIEALLIDEKLADQVWEAWDAGEIDTQIACLAWMMIARIFGFSSARLDAKLRRACRVRQFRSD